MLVSAALLVLMVMSVVEVVEVVASDQRLPLSPPALEGGS